MCGDQSSRVWGTESWLQWLELWIGKAIGKAMISCEWGWTNNGRFGTWKGGMEFSCLKRQNDTVRRNRKLNEWAMISKLENCNHVPTNFYNFRLWYSIKKNTALGFCDAIFKLALF